MKCNLLDACKKSHLLSAIIKATVVAIAFVHSACTPLARRNGAVFKES